MSGANRTLVLIIFALIVAIAVLAPWIAFVCYRAELGLPAGTNHRVLDLTSILDVAWAMACTRFG